MLVGAAGLSALIVAAWFPASDLLQEHRKLDSATAQLSAVRSENATLHKEAKQLKTPTKIASLAEQQDGLIAPGQNAYQVLPPSTSPSGSRSSSAGGGATPAGTRSDVTPPSDTAGEPAQSGTDHSSGQSSGTGSGSGGGFVNRVLQTLEFWR